VQHERAAQHAPRPLPLFLALLSDVSERDPDLARDALAGLRAYETAERAPRAPPKPELARVEGACLRDHGGEGPPAILIPSLINPPSILDLDSEVSLTEAISGMGRRTMLLDWGKASERSALSVARHIETLLQPLLRSIGEPAALVGYCLGGTMAIVPPRTSRHASVSSRSPRRGTSRFTRRARAARFATCGIIRKARQAI
jgi:polyhydroxyalkanoate synthase subunit PhaC